MRYIESGIQDKEFSYFFDLDRFNTQSYYILFDSTEQYVDLLGQTDISNVDFSYVS